MSLSAQSVISPVPSLMQKALEVHLINNPENKDEKDVVIDAISSEVMREKIGRGMGEREAQRVLSLKELSLSVYLNSRENDHKNGIIQDVSFQILYRGLAPLLPTDAYASIFAGRDKGALSSRFFRRVMAQELFPCALEWGFAEYFRERKIARMNRNVSDEEILRILRTGLISNSVREDGISHAVEDERIEILETLISHGPDPDNFRKKALSDAVRAKRFKVMESLITHASDPNRFRGMALVCAAAEENSIATIRFLLSKESIPYEYLVVAFNRLKDRNDFESIKIILILLPNEFLRTAIEQAMFLKQEGVVVRELLAIGEISDAFRKKALMDALINNQPEIVQALVATTPHPEFYREMAIRNAIAPDKELLEIHPNSRVLDGGNIVRYLLGSGEISDAFRKEAIVRALLEHQHEIVQTLIITSANPEFYREMALRTIAEHPDDRIRESYIGQKGGYSCVDVVKYLLKRGQISDSFREEAIDFALSMNGFEYLPCQITLYTTKNDLKKETR